MKIIKQIKDIDGDTRADGRGFVALNNEKAYISTNNGIYILDLNSLEIKGKIEGSENEHTDTYGKTYLGQSGTMLRINEKVYAVHQDKGLLIIDPETDKIIGTNAGPDNGKLGYGSAVLSKDGNMWLSVSDKFSNGTAYDFIIKYEPATGDTTRVEIPEGMTAPSNSWYAWTPDGFCASTQNNVLYWNAGNGVWYGDNQIYKYDIDKNEVSLFISFDDEDLKIYGSSMRVDPVTDNIYLTVFRDPSIPEFTLRKYDNKGNKIDEYPMSENYWFPSTPIFPDNAVPVAKTKDTTAHTGNDKFKIVLNDIADDADNMSAAMIKTITNITDRNVIDAEIKDGNINITPKSDGNSTVILNVNSNGKNTSAEVAINIKGCNGIDNVNVEMHNVFITDGTLHINNCNGYSFVVYNASGKAVSSFKANSDNYTCMLDVPSGIYFIKGTAANKNVAFKLSVR